MAADAEDSQLREALEAVAAKVADVRDMTADFEQTRFTPFLKRPLVSTGRILIKGERTRWETVTPRPSTMLIDRSGLRIHYPKQRKVEVYELGRGMGEMTASPLPRPQVLFEHFKIRRVPAAAAGGNDLILELVPLEKSMRKHIRRIVAHLDTEAGFVKTVEWTDADGERTLISFSNVETNTGLKDEDLELRPPAGTKVVRPLGGSKKGGGGAER